MEEKIQVHHLSVVWSRVEAKINQHLENTVNYKLTL